MKLKKPGVEMKTKEAGTIPLKNGEPLILVADDDDVLRRLLRQFLKHNGYSVVEAVNGVDAIDLFQSKKPDLVLLDAKMPMMDGFQACREMKKKPRGGKVPVVMVTALEDDNSVDRAFSAGAEDYITKPIHWPVLRQRVRLLIERKQAEEKIHRQANYDALTQLPNRNLFLDRLERALTMASRSKGHMALMYIDLDRFKWVNDTMGHAAGDQLLQQVSERLTCCVRKSDTVARLGGDEFTVILPDVTYPKDPRNVASKVLGELARPFPLEPGEAQISGSIGITVFPNDAQDVDTLLRNADHAMYIAKKMGKNAFWLFDAEKNN